MDETMREPLQRWLSERRHDAVDLVDVHRIATGNSRANWYAETADGARYVVRVEQGGVFGSASTDEFTMMQAAHALGCRVAQVRWLEPTGEVLGQPFFVMDYVDGVTTGRNDRSMSDQLSDDFVRRLAELHQADWASTISVTETGVEATHAAIDRWQAVYRAETDITIPLLEEGAAWLHHHAAEPARVGIVHGDPGPGNFVHDGSRVIAFTDWEFAHVGDPLEDWVYLITMRGASTMRRADWLGVFDRAAGVSVSESELRYWSVFNFFKGACANLTCRRVFRTVNPAPNMALIGTALHQTYVRQVARLTEEDRSGTH